MSRKNRQRGFTDENVAAIVESARRFVRCADEFLPDYRGAVGEYLSELIEDLDHLDDCRLSAVAISFRRIRRASGALRMAGRSMLVNP